MVRPNSVVVRGFRRLSQLLKYSGDRKNLDNFATRLNQHKRKTIISLQTACFSKLKSPLFHYTYFS